MLLVMTLISIRVVTSLDPATVDLLTPLKQLGEACGYEACPATKEGMLNVHIVPHSHGELGFRGTFYEHYTGYNEFFARSDTNMKKFMDATLTQLWAKTYRKFTLSDLPYFFHWWSQRDGTVRRMVYQLLRQGRLYLVGGGWSMNDEACTSYHAIIDSFTYSLRKLNATFMECGRPLVAWQADVLGHSREFTSLVAQMGYDGLFVNPMNMDDELARMIRQALEFVWRGSDDLGTETDMYTHKLFDGFWSPPGFCFSSMCDDPLIMTSDTLLSNAEERVDAFLESVRFRQAPNYNTSNIMVMMGVANGYFDAGMWYTNIDKLINLVNEKSYRLRKNVHVMYSAPPCYLKAVHESNPVLETKQDDMFPMASDRFSYTSGMYTSYPDVKLLAREGLVFLQISKQMQVLARLFKNDKFFEEFLWIMGVFQDHNIISGAMRHYVKKYYVEKIFRAIQKSTLLLKKAFNKLRNSPTGTMYYRCSLNISSCANIRTSAFIHIYNPLAWNVTIPVRLPVVNKQYTVYDPKGNIVTTALVKIPEHVLSIPLRETVADYELVFMAEDIPPLGYRNFFLQELFKLKRSITKKLKKKNKQFKTRQINNKRPMVAENSEYAYFDDDEYGEIAEPETEIIFGNRSNEVANSDVLTPANQPTIIFGNVPKNNNGDETSIVTPNIKHDTSLYSNIFSTEPSRQHLLQESTTIHQNFESEEYDIDRDIVADKLYVPQDSSTEGNDSILVAEYDTTTTANTEVVTRTESSTDTEKQIENSKLLTEENREFTERRLMQQFDMEINQTTQTPMPIATESKDQNETDTEDSPKEVIIKANYRNVTERNDEVTRTTEKNTGIYDLNQTDTNVPSIEKETNDTRKSGKKGGGLCIENKYVTINLDAASKKIKEVVLSNGVNISLDIQFYYYVSDVPEQLEDKKHVRNPDAYIFRSIDNIPVPIIGKPIDHAKDFRTIKDTTPPYKHGNKKIVHDDYLDTQIYKNDVVEEIHTSYSDYASIAVRLYTEQPVIEVEWLVGPVPADDGLGKEVFVRYMTDLVNDGAFYTDSNGRQTMKRIRNLRPMYDIGSNDPVSGNYYPVTSKIYIEDTTKNIRFSVFNDRSQGGTSLYDGEIDIMLQRRIFTTDYRIESPVNETHEGIGIMIRGKHYLYLSKADYKPNKMFEKKFAKEIELRPQIFLSVEKPYGDNSIEHWKKHNNEISFLKNKLPVGVHVLTLEEWNEGSVLLRLENFLEKADTVKSGKKKVFIKNLFTNIKINEVRETTLAANMWLKDYVPLRWNQKDKFVRNFNEFYGTSKKVEFAEDSVSIKDVDINAGIILVPQQIRTFVCQFEYV